MKITEFRYRELKTGERYSNVAIEVASIVDDGEDATASGGSATI